VQAGAVFAEVSADPSLDAETRAEVGTLCRVSPTSIVPPAPAASSPLANSTVWLTETHRFARDSGIGALAAAINAGDAAAVQGLMRAGSDASLAWLHDDGQLAAHIERGYAAYLDALRRHLGDMGDPGKAGERGDPAAVTRAFETFRVLCAVNDGPRGVSVLNRQCEQWLRAALADAPSMPAARSAWYPGRPVMVLRNDYVLSLFNGDVGIALPDASGALHIHFPGPAQTFRAIAPARLPEHETAFAITVHKAQGSEFDRIVVVLPERRSPVLTRELLYTAVTRARNEVTLCASTAALEAAVATPTRRHSGLLARLRTGGARPAPAGGR
jgi:exodeoxyribonuclease V alpha subunit